MAVYIKPPKGNINLIKLCTFIKKRLLFLYFVKDKSPVEIKSEIDKEEYLDDFDCLIEGSMKDKISHFVLRFLCSSDADMKSFFIQSETALFKYRLEFYSKGDLEKLMFNAYKQCKETLQYAGIITTYRNVLETFIRLVDDYEIVTQKEDSFVKVPFIYVLDMVKNRLHHLTSGLVCVPLTELKHLLISFSEEFVYQGILQTTSSPSTEHYNDPRLSYMTNEIKSWFKSKVSVFTSISDNNNIILEKQLDKESLKFPLCMKNIHLLLRKTHRLPHNARVQYILFLKEIGVPYQEVLSLFSKEYSFPVSSTSACNHSWNCSKNRYTYSIQHLFGKKGSQKNYHAHSCFTLQSFESRSVYHGGCPFSCFDNDSLSRSLHSENLQVIDIEDIKLFSNSKKYTKACNYFLSKRLQSLEQTTVNLKNDSNLCLGSCKTKIDSLNSKQISLNNILKQREKFVCCHDNFPNVISRPSEFYFILSHFMNGMI